MKDKWGTHGPYEYKSVRVGKRVISKYIGKIGGAIGGRDPNIKTATKGGGHNKRGS